jgi:hypothetical protein
MVRLIASILAAASLAAAPSTAWADWSQPSGGSLDVVPGAGAGDSSLADVGGVPYAAWEERSAGHAQIFVRRLEGTSWVRVGGSLNVDSTKDAKSPDIASLGGVPFVAWTETDGTHDQLYVKRFDGEDWVPVGDRSLNVKASSDAAHASIVAVAGVPYVAWDEQQAGGNPLVFVARFDGREWVPLGGGALNRDSGGWARSPKLADVNGVPYVVWSEWNGEHTLIHVRSFDGGAFHRVGSDPLNLNPGQDAGAPSIALVDGTPYVAWDEWNGIALQIRVKRLSGAGWRTVGGSLNVDPAENADAPTIASIGGAPAVVWQEWGGAVEQIRFSRFDGTSWRAVGGPLNVDPSQNAQFVDPALIDVGGVPYVTWMEANGMTSEIRVKRLEPDILAESAVPSAGGVSLAAVLDDFDMPLPVGFEYGTGAFSTQTPLRLSAGAGVSTITETLGGLPAGTGYVFRAFGSDTFRETSVGATAGFSTPPLPAGILSGVASRATPGRITRLVLRPSSFSARIGAGTGVSYVDSEPAMTTFTVQRAVAGPRGTRYVGVGSFAHADVAGANRFRFIGRVRGRALAPGRYRLQAIPHNSGGSGPPAYRKFEVTR